FREWQNSQSRQSLFLADLSRQQVEKSDPVAGVLLALEGLPDRDSDDPTLWLRPYVPAAEFRLFGAANEIRNFYRGRKSASNSMLSNGGTSLMERHGQGRFSLHDVETGAVIFKGEAAPSEHWPAFTTNESLVYVDNAGNLVLLDARSGEILKRL